MTCDQCVEALLDLACSGGQAPEPVRAHLAQCHQCPQRLQDQLALTAGLRALVKASATNEPSEALELRLLALFDEHLAAKEPVPAAARPLRVWWTRAAAILVVATGGTIAWLHVAGDSRPVTVAHKATAPSTTALVQEALPPPPSPPATPAQPHRAAGRHRATPRPVVAQGFVPLPWTTNLPDFDRGRIVRLDIPVAALPLYGLGIPADAAATAVRADMLVGQDGQPRGIRLVTPQPARRP